ncbi:Hok/Gef family protein [Enterobacter hormaechei subsp. steigerwaltii]|nr:Hok/Gef family protein [Enterobacter hormaechei subsp. steigerwaltii]
MCITILTFTLLTRQTLYELRFRDGDKEVAALHSLSPCRMAGKRLTSELLRFVRWPQVDRNIGRGLRLSDSRLA